MLATPLAESPRKMIAKQTSPTTVTASPQPIWFKAQDASTASALERELYSQLVTALKAKLRAGHLLTDDEGTFLGIDPGSRRRPSQALVPPPATPVSTPAQPVATLVQSDHISAPVLPVIRRHTYYGVTHTMRMPGPDAASSLASL